MRLNNYNKIRANTEAIQENKTKMDKLQDNQEDLLGRIRELESRLLTRAADQEQN